MTDIPPHFHKKGSPEGQVSEVDIVPDGRTIAAVPDFAAPEGTEVTFYDGATFTRYKMVDGVWRALAGNDIFDDFLDLVHWSSLDGSTIITSGSGSTLLEDPELWLSTSGIVNSYHGLRSNSVYRQLNVTGKPVTAEFIVTGLDAVTGAGFPMTDCEIRAYFTTSAAFPSDTDDHFGFKLIGDGTGLVMKGSTADGTTEATATLDSYNFKQGFQLIRLKLVLTPGTDCKFYINGALVGALTTNLPTVNDFLLSLTVKTTDTVAKGSVFGRVLIKRAA